MGTIQMLQVANNQLPSEAIELINNVDAYYNSAWEKLIVMGSVAFGVIGIVVPLIIQWYQKKANNASEELLKKEIENQTIKLKEELMNETHRILEEKVKVYEGTIFKLNAISKARTFHLQGNSSISNKDYSGAFSDFVIAAENYLIGDDFTNLQGVLQSILEQCLPYITNEVISDLKISDDCDIDKLLDDIQKADKFGSFSRAIRDIKLGIIKLPQK